MVFLSFPSYAIQEDHGLGTLQCRVEGSYIGMFDKECDFKISTISFSVSGKKTISRIGSQKNDNNSYH